MRLRPTSGLFVLAYLTVYLGFIPALGETQPLLFVLCGLAMIFCVCKNEYIQRFDLASACVLTSVFFCLLYALVGILFGITHIFILVKYTVAGLVCLGVIYLFDKIYVDLKALKVLTFILLAVGIVQAFEVPLLSEALLLIQNAFMPRAVDSAQVADRGITLLAPEQSYAALMVSVLLGLLETLNS